MEQFEGGIRRLKEEKEPSCSISSVFSPSKPTLTRGSGDQLRAHMPKKRMRQLLEELESDAVDELDDDLLAVYRALRKAGLEILLSESERVVRSIDASEPPKFVSAILLSDVPSIIAKPKDPDQVRRCVQLCRRHGVPLVVRGAASSAFGAVLPPDGGLVLDIGELAGILSIDRERLLVNVLSGTRWADLSLELKKSGLALKSSPSSLFSTIGGWFSTGGIGINSFSFGEISRLVRRINVVFPNGKAASLSPKDPRFKLFMGTEGQLGVVTELILSVRLAPKYTRALLLQTSTDAHAFRLIASVLRSGMPLAHMLYFDENRCKEINRLTPIPGKPLHEAPAVLLQIEGDSLEALEPRLPADVSWSMAPEFMANLLWNERYFPMRGRRHGPGMLGAELIVPLSSMPRYLARVRKLGRMFGVNVTSDAHILSDGEALVLSFFNTDQRRQIMYSIHAALSMLITRVGIEFKGRPYAIGIWNQPFSSFVISRERMDELRRRKQELDPDDLFNPGKFLSTSSKLSTTFGIFLKERIPLFALGSFLAAAEFIGRLSRSILSAGRREEPSPLDLSLLACARCGACVSVCPAYIVTGRELVTGRGKLLIARRIMNGEMPSEAEAREIFLCMKCHACEEVCQTRLPLLSAYEELEEILEAEFGRPKELIEGFVAEVEASPEYERLMYDGVISPDAGIKEGESDAV